MKALIIVIIAFLAVVYVYAYLTHKKRKKQLQGIDSISDFKKKYGDHLIAGKPVTADTLDYIERSALVEEAKAMQQPPEYEKNRSHGRKTVIGGNQH